ncbi:GxxExxY protein [Pelovirga terrestris]|uniref:GxxExxY protein n=1 Tax=Pelovirga terrestris TaxID=2771352 RepID=A0A8J6QW46_9BACT|nr:GxxExxY protein [Pelovirga terrestris]MBD1399333.1 GxxExxY protein [Pelovirga terrestris]
MDENDIGKIVVDVAIKLHRETGPGLLESVYEALLEHDLKIRGFQVSRQMAISLNYRGIKFDEGFRADIIVENKVILELKSVDKISKVHKKQVLTYLKLTGLKLGYLLNFGEERMIDGIVRLVNDL